MILKTQARTTKFFFPPSFSLYYFTETHNLKTAVGRCILKFVTSITRTCIFISETICLDISSSVWSHEWKKFLHTFFLAFFSFLFACENKVAESSRRVMYLLALLCTEIGGNLFFPSAVNATFL